MADNNGISTNAVNANDTVMVQQGVEFSVIASTPIVTARSSAHSVPVTAADSNLITQTQTQTPTPTQTPTQTQTQIETCTPQQRQQHPDAGTSFLASTSPQLLFGMEISPHKEFSTTSLLHNNNIEHVEQAPLPHSASNDDSTPVADDGVAMNPKSTNNFEGRNRKNRFISDIQARNTLLTDLRSIPIPKTSSAALESHVRVIPIRDTPTLVIVGDESSYPTSNATQQGCNSVVKRARAGDPLHEQIRKETNKKRKNTTLTKDGGGSLRQRRGAEVASSQIARTHVRNDAVTTYQPLHSMTSLRLRTLLIEEIMTIPIGTSVVVLFSDTGIVPRYNNKHMRAWKTAHQRLPDVVVEKRTYHQLQGHVVANPELCRLQAGLDRQQLFDLFNERLQTGLVVSLPTHASSSCQCNSARQSTPSLQLRVSWFELLFSVGLFFCKLRFLGCSIYKKRLIALDRTLLDLLYFTAWCRRQTATRLFFMNS